MMKISDLFRSLHEYFDERRFVVFTLSLIFILLMIVLYYSTGFAGGSDSISHYYFAHYAFKFPEFFFNHWAKPVFTLLAAPFAFFGFKGIQFFNILVAIAAGFFSYLVAKELKMKQPILAIILCCFAPIFAYNIFSGLTEILFALGIIVATYFYLKDRYVLASIIVSILPLIRNEGIFLIPIYAIFLANKKHYKIILLMLLGLAIYSIIGSYYNHGLFWFFTQTPYRSALGVYGTGSFFQYIKRSPGFFGIPNEIFYVTGLVAGITLYLREKKEYSKEFLLVVLPFLTYFFAHSFMWWSGIGNSQGTNRYMAAIVPLMAVMSTRGLTLFSLMFEIIFKSTWVKTAALYIGILSVIHIPFVVQNYPIPLDKYSKVLKQSTDWISQKGLDKSKIYYKDATIPYMLGLNPFDKTRCQNVFDDLKKSSSSIEVGSILIYDERFYPVDNVEFDSLVQNNYFELQKVFEPEQNIKVYGRDYRVAVFKRIVPDSSVLNQNRMMAYGSKEYIKSLTSIFFDKNIDHADSTSVYFDDKNDTKCLKINGVKDRYLEKEFDLSTISFEKPLELYLRLKIKPQDTLKLPLLYVVEVNRNGKQLYYNEIKLEPKVYDLALWSDLDYHVKLPADISFNGNLKVCFLNKNKGVYLIDDYQLGYCHKR